VVESLSRVFHHVGLFSWKRETGATTGEEQGGDVVVRVRDSGIGIDPEMLPHIFDPFWQVERTFDHSQGGLGIGLALVQKLVEMNGGSASASSAGRGHGSEFVVRFPARAEVLENVC